MNKEIHILHLEDDANDARIVKLKLQSGILNFQIENVQSKETYEKALWNGNFNIILADFNLPGYDGISALKYAREHFPDIPFIFVSGALGEDAAIEGLTEGATDYVLKQKLSRLVPAVTRAMNEAESKLKRKQAEEELKIKTRELDQYFTNAIDLLCIADIKGIFRRLNPQWEVTLGYSIDELLGRNFFEYIHEEDIDKTNKAISMLSEQKEVLNFINRYRCKKGNYKWIEWRSYPMGELVYAVARDITDRIESEQALRKLNRELRAISNCNQALLRAEDEITLLNEICNIICNETGYNMAWVGYAMNDRQKSIIPVSSAGINPGYLDELKLSWADPDTEKSLAGKAIITGIPAFIQNMSDLNNKEFIVDSSFKNKYQSCISIPLKDEKAVTFGALSLYSSEKNAFNNDELRLLEELSGDLAYGIVTLRGRKEREKAEKEIRKLSQAVEQSPVSIVITDPYGNIEYVNNKFSKITGYTREEAIGQNPRILKSGELSPDKYTEMWKTISEGKEWFGEFHNKKKSGELYWELASISPIKDKAGNTINYLAVKEDITQRKQTEKELIAAKEKAEESDKLKTAFLCNMSHEIRTPMNAILGFSDFLLDPDISEERKKHYADIIKARSFDLLRIIEDILDISKIEVGQMNIHESPTNIERIIEELLEYYRFKIAESEKKQLLTLKTNLSCDLTNRLIITDGQRLKQIIGNLMDNAFKFTPSGYIELGCSVVDKELLLYVKDTGIGIKPGMEHIIFDPFRQVEDTKQEKQFGGTGLGLSIVKGLIKLMHGKVWFHSEIDKGTTFYFTIPFKDAEI